MKRVSGKNDQPQNCNLYFKFHFERIEADHTLETSITDQREIAWVTIKEIGTVSLKSALVGTYNIEI